MRSYVDAARAIPMSYQGLRKSIDSLELALKMLLFSKLADGSLISTKQADLLYERTICWYEDVHSLSLDIAASLGGAPPSTSSCRLERSAFSGRDRWKSSNPVNKPYVQIATNTPIS